MVVPNKETITSLLASARAALQLRNSKVALERLNLAQSELSKIDQANMDVDGLFEIENLLQECRVLTEQAEKL